VENQACSFNDEAVTPATFNLCDELKSPVRTSQRFSFKPQGIGKHGELVSAAAQMSGAVKACVGWGSSTIEDGAALMLVECDGSNIWDESFWRDTAAETPVHGAYFFDQYRNMDQRGSVTVIPEAISALNVEFGNDLKDFAPWNTSVMSVIVAGNSSVSVTTNSCPTEGCNAHVPDDIPTSRTFMWSDTAMWQRLNASVPCDHEPLLTNVNRLCSYEAPCSCGDVVIGKDWTVYLDQSTPYLNTLTIRGRLIVPHNLATPVALHANLVDLRGGQLMVGNASHPYVGPLFQLVLHGDLYMHGKQ
jgi:hypothetical protein